MRGGKAEESEYDSEYDDEEASEESDKSSEEEADNKGDEEEQKEGEGEGEDDEKTRILKNLKDIEEYGNPGQGFEWASDVDSQGKQIWGEEGEDWDFYYEEDAESYHRGESTLPPLLNPNQIYDQSFLEGVNLKDATKKDGSKAKVSEDRAKMVSNIKARIAKDEDGALYRTAKKKMHSKTDTQRTGGGHKIIDKKPATTVKK